MKDISDISNRITFSAIFSLLLIILGSLFVYTKLSNSLENAPSKINPTQIIENTASPTITSSEVPETPPQIPTPTFTYTEVTKVIDGDTIEIEGGQTVRYIGINTPETKDPRKKVECFGVRAYEKNKELVEGKTVRLEKDVSETDKYGRLLRYIYIDDLFVNEYLVRQGYAQVSTFPPDVKYIDVFVEAQRLAMEENLGLWRECR